MFIVIEGLDGSGKTTQAKMLHEALIKRGHNPLSVREPGSTYISEQIRTVLHDGRNAGMTAKCEALLYAAARAQLMEKTVIPALKMGRTVICDRYVPSSIAYQGYGRDMAGNSDADIYTINGFATGYKYQPDAIIYLNVPAEDALRRRAQAGDVNRMDKEPLAFHRRVAAGYACASQDTLHGFGDVWHDVDGVGGVDEVHGRVMAVVDRLFEGIPHVV